MTALNKQAHQTENERMAQSLAERNGEPVEGLRQRISELEEIATDYGMKFQKAQDALRHQSLLHKSQMESAEKRIAELEARKVTVKLPADYRNSDGSINADMFNTCEVVGAFREALASVGIGVKGE